MNWMKRLGNDEHGLATVEMAIALPVLLLILFGTIAGGYLLFAKHQMDRASREGARTWILYDHDALSCSDINSVVHQTLTTPLQSESITHTVGGTPPLAKVSINGGVTLPILGFVFGDEHGTIPLSASTSMVPEWSHTPNCTG